jgi:subtilisin family serine protease
MPARPNPSMLVVDCPRNSERSRLAAALLAEAGAGEAGDPLTRLLRTQPDPLDWLARQPGVVLARQMRADQVVAMLGARDPADRTLRRRALAAAPAAVPWHFKELGVPEARAHVDTAAPGALPQVRIAQLDTGYTEHPCFGSWTGSANPHVRADLGVNYVEGGGLPRDPFESQYPGFPGHGTRIGSVIAANDPGGMQGVAAGVTLIPYRVTNTVVVNFMGNETPLDAALMHAIRNNGCKVVNVSLGDPCFPGRANGRAVDYAYDHGVIVVAAAGNVTSEVTYPARHSRSIAAGGVTRRFEPWSGGARGARVDFCAPADEIFRASWRPKDGGWEPVYEQGGDGTSYAAAHVSGIACLWLALHRQQLAGYPQPWQTVEAFRKVVAETCVRPPGWDQALFGAGVVNAKAALEAPLPDPATLRYDPDLAEDDIV